MEILYFIGGSMFGAFVTLLTFTLIRSGDGSVREDVTAEREKSS